jgi:hypothetical protein
VETAVAVNEAPAPLQPSETLWAAGALPPAAAANVSSGGANDRLDVSAGGPAAAVTARFTVTIKAPAHEAGVIIEIEPEYDPGLSPAGSTETTTVPGVGPIDGLALSQVPELKAEKLVTSDPQAIGIDWASGAAPPA